MREIGVAMNITEGDDPRSREGDVPPKWRLQAAYRRGGRGDIPPEPVTAMSHAKFAKAAKMTGDLANLADLA